ncbi:MAG: ribonuclease P protein component [Bacteroidales bacterium]|nr:ribonuclease P protein component [Bacteroidales bacterium]
MYTFGKQERLCSTKLTDALFRTGHKFMVFPYSVHWMLCPPGTLPPGTPAQVLIATSKKKFHHAVDRNRVKRLTRECYRLHKPQLYHTLTARNLTITLALNYIHNEIFDYQKLDQKVGRIVETLIQQIESQPPQPDNQAS